MSENQNNRTKQRAPNGVMTRRPISLELPASARESVERLAKSEARTVASCARWLALQGLDAFKADRAVLGDAADRLGQLAGPAIALRMLPHEREDLSTVAAAEMRSLASFARLLVLIGLVMVERERG